MAHFTATIWQTISSDIINNKIDTNTFIFSANVTKKISSIFSLFENLASLTNCDSLNQFEFRDTFLGYVSSA